MEAMFDNLISFTKSSEVGIVPVAYNEVNEGVLFQIIAIALIINTRYSIDGSK